MAKPVKHGHSWRIRWIDATGKRRSEVYDSRDDATFALRRHEIETDEVSRGLRKLTAPKKSFNELADFYLKYYSSQKRNPADDLGTVRKHLRPYFGHLQLREIQNHVDEFKLSKIHLNKKTLHNILTLLITMLRVAEEKKWLDAIPRIKKPKIRIFEKDFSYLRTKDEIAKFLNAARQETDASVCLLYAVAIYTGLREGEIAGLQWSDIDFNQRLITVQRSFLGLTKNGEVRYVPILDPIYKPLLEWKLKNPLPLVFPNQAGRMLGRSARIFQEVFHRVLARAEFPSSLRQDKIRRYIVFHDLRHTFASHWMTSGGDLFKLQKILGHKSMQMTLRYAHLAPHAFTDDLSRMGSNSISSHQSAPVIPIVLQKN